MQPTLGPEASADLADRAPHGAVAPRTDQADDTQLDGEDYEWDAFLPDPDEAVLDEQARQEAEAAELELDDSEFDWEAALEDDADADSMDVARVEAAFDRMQDSVTRLYDEDAESPTDDAMRERATTAALAQPTPDDDEPEFELVEESELDRLGTATGLGPAAESASGPESEVHDEPELVVLPDTNGAAFSLAEALQADADAGPYGAHAEDAVADHEVWDAADVERTDPRELDESPTEESVEDGVIAAFTRWVAENRDDGDDEEDLAHPAEVQGDDDLLESAHDSAEGDEWGGPGMGEAAPASEDDLDDDATTWVAAFESDDGSQEPPAWARSSTRDDDLWVAATADPGAGAPEAAFAQVSGSDDEPWSGAPDDVLAEPLSESVVPLDAPVHAEFWDDASAIKAEGDVDLDVPLDVEGDVAANAPSQPRDPRVKRNTRHSRVFTATVVVGCLFLVAIAGVGIARALHHSPGTAAGTNTGAGNSGSVARLQTATDTADSATTTAQAELATLPGFPTPTNVGAVVNPYVASLQLYETFLSGATVPAAAGPATRAVAADLHRDVPFLTTINGLPPAHLGAYIVQFSEDAGHLQADLSTLEQSLRSS